MDKTTKEVIRQAVRERYGQIANANTPAQGINIMGSCCGESPAASGKSSAGSCCGSGSDVTSEQMSALMGYSKQDLACAPEGANMGLGCGNPVALASLQPGETVVDLGSGGGFDCFLAAKQVGETGQVIGVDMTPDMISKARANAAKIQAKNVEFRLGEIEHLPVADDTADIIMSNCVINLSPDKLSVFREAYRILKPGGRLAISDVLAIAALPDEIRQNLALVSACVGGAATIDDTRAMLTQAGFENIKITPKDGSRQLISEWTSGDSKNAGDYVVSAYIEATKPISGY
ncbi:MAG: arsenite methyltransferase [Deltaproteobacteria bacterium]|jgi:SAM-dependent methyltransferase|nr:arsenite methyltransferase [Deltaproteobacteria bacterium]